MQKKFQVLVNSMPTTREGGIQKVTLLRDFIKFKKVQAESIQ